MRTLSTAFVTVRRVVEVQKIGRCSNLPAPAPARVDGDTGVQIRGIFLLSVTRRLSHRQPALAWLLRPIWRVTANRVAATVRLVRVRWLHVDRHAAWSPRLAGMSLRGRRYQCHHQSDPESRSRARPGRTAVSIAAGASLDVCQMRNGCKSIRLRDPSRPYWQR